MLRANLIVITALAASAGCKSKDADKSPSGNAGKTVASAGAAAATGAAPAAAEAATGGRQDLSKAKTPLPISVELPAGATLKWSTDKWPDDKGNLVDVTTVDIDSPVGGALISTDAAKVPFEYTKDVVKNDTILVEQHESADHWLLATKEATTGTVAIVARAHGVRCEGVMLPEASYQNVVKICASIQPAH